MPRTWSPKRGDLIRNLVFHAGEDAAIRLLHPYTFEEALKIGSDVAVNLDQKKQDALRQIESLRNDWGK